MTFFHDIFGMAVSLNSFPLILFENFRQRREISLAGIEKFNANLP
jgi:hypothetical protein